MCCLPKGHYSRNCWKIGHLSNKVLLLCQFFLFFRKFPLSKNDENQNMLYAMLTVNTISCTINFTSAVYSQLILRRNLEIRV